MARNGVPYKAVMDADDQLAFYSRQSKIQQDIIDKASKPNGVVTDADRLKYDEAVSRQSDVTAAVGRNDARYAELARLSASNIQTQHQIIQQAMQGQGAGALTGAGVIAAKLLIKFGPERVHERDFPETALKKFSNHGVGRKIIAAHRRSVQVGLSKG